MAGTAARKHRGRTKTAPAARIQHETKERAWPRILAKAAEIAVLPLIFTILGIILSNSLSAQLAHQQETSDRKFSRDMARNQELLENVRWLRTLSGVRGVERPFEDLDLQGASLSGLYLNCVDDEEKTDEKSCADFSRANLTGASLFHTDLSGSFIADAKLQRVDMAAGALVKAEIISSDMSHAWLQGSSFRDADVQDVDLSGANLACSDFEGATFTNVKMTNADLQCVDMSKTVFDNVDITGICWNKETIPPKGVLFPKSDKAHCRKAT